MRCAPPGFGAAGLELTFQPGRRRAREDTLGRLRNPARPAQPRRLTLRTSHFPNPPSSSPRAGPLTKRGAKVGPCARPVPGRLLQVHSAPLRPFEGRSIAAPAARSPRPADRKSAASATTPLPQPRPLSSTDRPPRCSIGARRPWKRTTPTDTGRHTVLASTRVNDTEWHSENRIDTNQFGLLIRGFGVRVPGGAR